MKSGGLLFAGHSENFTYVTQAFRLRGQTVYELTRDAAGARAPARTTASTSTTTSTTSATSATTSGVTV
jgi:chemotaxis protein methyltransferase CheR